MTEATLDIDAVAQSLLDAAVDPSLWGKAMDITAEYAGAHGATILPVKGRMAVVPLSQSMQGIFKDYVNEGWYLRDERERGLEVMRRKGIFTDQDFASSEELNSSDYYRGFLARHSFNWSAGIGIKSGDDEFCLILGRGDKEGHFSEHEQATLLRLSAPLKQAAAIGHHFSYGKALGLNEAFDLIGSASILINRFGKIFRCNRAAERYFTDGLFLSGGELSCGLAAETAALKRMIFSCCIETTFGEFANVRSLVITRPSGRPLVIQVVRLAGMVGDIFSPARVLLFIIDPFTQLANVPTAEIQKVFGLTNAETALLIVLEKDTSLPHAAEQLGISYETARSQLKSILHRTDTKRQSELLALLRRLSQRVR